MLESGTPLKQAVQEALALLREGIEIGSIGTTVDEAEVVSRKPMASARLAQED